MLAMWCWPQQFGQPLILMWIFCVSGSLMSSDSTLLLDGAVQAHRARDAELAAVRAGAANDVRDGLGAGIAEVEVA